MAGIGDVATSCGHLGGREYRGDRRRAYVRAMQSASPSLHGLIDDTTRISRALDPHTETRKRRRPLRVHVRYPYEARSRGLNNAVHCYWSKQYRYCRFLEIKVQLIIPIVTHTPRAFQSLRIPRLPRQSTAALSSVAVDCHYCFRTLHSHSIYQGES